MRELRTVTTSFQAKKSENERIKIVAHSLDLGMSEYMRNLVMNDVIKREKKMEK